jgi:hypothetical protein
MPLTSLAATALDQVGGHHNYTQKGVFDSPESSINIPFLASRDTATTDCRPMMFLNVAAGFADG